MLIKRKILQIHLNTLFGVHTRRERKAAMPPQTTKYLPRQNYVPLTQAKYILLPHCREYRFYPNRSPMTCFQRDDLMIERFSSFVHNCMYFVLQSLSEQQMQAGTTVACAVKVNILQKVKKKQTALNICLMMSY